MNAEVAQPTVETKTIVKQNGIKRPDSESITGKLWDIADQISEQKGAPALRKEVVDRYMNEVPGANQATANTQYARWVSFHGVSHILKQQRLAETEARRQEAKAKAAEAAAARAAEKAEAAAKRKAEREEKRAAREAEKQAKAEAAAAKKAEREAAKQAAAEEKARKAAEAAAAAENGEVAE